MEKKLRGRPLKREQDKLIGRRISMVKAGWDTIDLLCAKHDMTIEGLLYITCASMCMDNQTQPENQEA